MSEKSLPGVIKGDTYVPFISQQTQANWINSFFAQNGFIDFDTLRRLEIDDPARFAKKAFPEHLFLQDRVINRTLVHQVDAAIEDAVARDSVVDIWVLPFPTFLFFLCFPTSLLSFPNIGHSSLPSVGK